MRPVSNLYGVNQRFLSRERQGGFFALYQGLFGGGHANAKIELYYTLWSRALWPQLRTHQAKMKDISESTIDQMRDEEGLRVRRAILRKNVAKGLLEFDLPLIKVQNEMASGRLTYVDEEILRRATEGAITKNAYQNITNTAASGRIVTGEEISASLFPGRAAAAIKECVQGVYIEPDGRDHSMVWAKFLIPQDVAEFLTNSDFVELRMSDIYPSLLMWGSSCFGRFSRVPRAVTKVSQISKETNALKPVIKTGLLGLVADIEASIYYIPELNKSMEYEQQLLDYGLQEDGSYTFEPAVQELPEGSFKVGEDVPQVQRRRMPRNMPVFADWVNDKFCYSNTVGNLAVYDLSDTVPASAIHIRKVLERNFGGITARNTSSGSGRLGWLRTMVTHAMSLDKTIAKDQSFKPRKEDFQDAKVWAKVEKFVNSASFHSENDVFNAFNGILADVSEEGLADVSLSDVLDGKRDDSKWLARLIQKCAAVAEANVEVLYEKISVMSALQVMAYAKIVRNFAGKYVEIVEKDQAARGKYLNQGVDPNWQQDGTPYVKDDLTYQAHQARIDNEMRESPAFAMYDVDAGGGKSITVLGNILCEMKRGHTKKPIVCCPSTLVSQYVEEAVFVTEGRVNVIPLTGATLRMHGYDRLKMMIERAPINTVVVTDFDFVKGKASHIAYGNKWMIVFNNAEWLRQFEFDMVVIDESHKMANLDSTRRQAMSRFMQDIRYKRLASGTFVSNTLPDLVSQVALFDQTIFGSRTQFQDEFGEQTDGGKFTGFRPGAEREIRRRIRENVVVASARRKEWASKLPPFAEEFFFVDMTPNQRLLYESILKQTTDMIEEAIAKNEELREAMENSDVSESVAENLEAMLRPYLVRLERFMSAPEADELASTFLPAPEDKVSPKVLKVYERIRGHFESNQPGKIIIFTNFKESAKAIYENAPPDIKAQMLHYTAGKKMECRAKFAKDDRIRVMVGVASSMDTGINFQIASRLIRLELPWTPGVVEQGNSRVNRPQLKEVEKRTKVYVDWIMINRSVDVTKCSRLISKMVSKAKFDEPDVQEYQDLPDLPSVKMTLDSIKGMNDFEGVLLPYLEAYSDYKKAEAREFKRYYEENKDKLQNVKVKRAPNLPGSKFMSRVPYVPGMTIYGEDQLGLLRYDEFVEKDLDDEELAETEIDTGVSELESKDAHRQYMKAKWEAEKKLAVGMGAHTELGDGEITNVANKVTVRLANTNELIRVPKLQLFVITRTTTNGKDIRLELQKAAGDLPLDAPIEVPVERGTQTERRKQKLETPTERPTKKVVGVSLSLSVLNDTIAIMADGADNQSGATAIQSLGFRVSPEYVVTRIYNPTRLYDLFKTLSDKGYKMSKRNSLEIKTIYDELKNDKSQLSRPGFATSMEIKQLTMDLIKPEADPKLIMIFPRVEDGFLYMVMPTRGHAANVKASKVPVLGVKWVAGGGDTELIRFCKNKAEAKKVLEEIQASGIAILNKDRLKKQWDALKMGR